MVRYLVRKWKLKFAQKRQKLVDTEINLALKRAKSMRLVTSSRFEEEMPKRAKICDVTAFPSKRVEEEVPMPISRHRTLPTFLSSELAEYLNENEKKVESCESSSW